MQHAVFAFELGSFARAMRNEGLFDMRAVFDVNAVEPLLRSVADFVRLEPEDRLPSFRVIDAVGPQIPIPQAVVRTLGG